MWKRKKMSKLYLNGETTGQENVEAGNKRPHPSPSKGACKTTEKNARSAQAKPIEVQSSQGKYQLSSHILLISSS